MSSMQHNMVVLDPDHIARVVEELGAQCELDDDDRDAIRRVLGLFPRAADVVFDDTAAPELTQLPLNDKFTFELENDRLLIYSRDAETLVDALIEMAMYLWGFATLIGNDDEWVIEFTIGAWKPVKKHIKRRLELQVFEHPRGVVGLPPIAEDFSADQYPFRTLVSNYDRASFQQMAVLAARDDIAVYFPPETHPKVLAAYVYMRRAIQEVAQGLDLPDYQKFNQRLLQALGRLEGLFRPSKLPPPTWAGSGLASRDQGPIFHDDPDGVPGPYPDEHLQRPPLSPAEPFDPFEAFIEELLADDDERRN